MMETIENCMKYVDQAHAIAEGIDSRDGIIMILGTLFDEWSAKHDVPFEKQKELLKLLCETHNSVYEAIGGFQL